MVWATSSIPRSNLTADYNHLTSTYGYAGEAATITNLTKTMYAYGDWTGSPGWDPTALSSQVLCDIANSRDGVENLSTATEVLCESPTASSASKRMFDEVSQTTRSANGDQSTIIIASRGVLNVSNLSPMRNLELHLNLTAHLSLGRLSISLHAMDLD